MITLLLILGNTLVSASLMAECSLANLPAPPNRPADFVELVRSLRSLGVETHDEELYEIFHSEPPKTKLEQFFRLLYYIQKQRLETLPVSVSRPGITEVLMAARVFTDPAFPGHISNVYLEKKKRRGPPTYVVYFDLPEVRFPLNEGNGFAVWTHGKCQIAKKLIFYPGFSFRIREKKKNLIVQDFEKVQIFGEFGAHHGPLKIDLNYVDLERVEFIHGTDEGYVKSRVADREFETNSHSFLFKLIGRIIPDNSRQRIDW